MFDMDEATRPRLVLAICCLSVFIVSLDNTIVNVALPSIRRDLHAAVSELQWTIDAYTVVLAGLLMVSGAAADRLGRAKIFQLGLAVFTFGSLLCSLSPSPGALIAFRMLQAVGGSMLNPVAMSIIRNTFDDARQRAMAIGVWGAVVGLSMALGPLLGGVLVTTISWRSIFWVNVPVGLAAIALTHRFVPESRAPHPRAVDWLGQALIMVALASLTYSIIEGASAGWGSPVILALAALAIIALIVFVTHERRDDEPLIDPRFFRSAPFSGATLIAVAAFTALGGFLFVTQLYLQGDRGLSPVSSGLYTLPMAATAFIAAPLSGRLVGARGARPSLLIGGAGLAISSLMLTDLTAHTSVGHLLLAYFVFGLGFGMVNPPITNTAISGMPEAQAGVAAAVASTSRLIGISLGVAIVGAIVAPGSAAGAHAAFGQASHPVWWLLAVCGFAVVAIGALSTSPWALRTAEAASAMASG
ncbi:MAG TPA: MFS transporter [Solirubrobacteraceae bacterium]|nr:MFS transporter [Solirubrobacteraceae bacterium]